MNSKQKKRLGDVLIIGSILFFVGGLVLMLKTGISFIPKKVTAFYTITGKPAKEIRIERYRYLNLLEIVIHPMSLINSDQTLAQKCLTDEKGETSFNFTSDYENYYIYSTPETTKKGGLTLKIKNKVIQFEPDSSQPAVSNWIYQIKFEGQRVETNRFEKDKIYRDH